MPLDGQHMAELPHNPPSMESVLKRIIMRLRCPDIGAISDATAERLIAELGLKHA